MIFTVPSNFKNYLISSIQKEAECEIPIGMESARTNNESNELKKDDNDKIRTLPTVFLEEQVEEFSMKDDYTRNRRKSPGLSYNLSAQIEDEDSKIPSNLFNCKIKEVKPPSSSAMICSSDEIAKTIYCNNRMKFADLIAHLNFGYIKK